MIRVPCDEDDEDDGDEEEDEEQEEPGKFSGILGGYRTPNGYGGGVCEGDCDDGSGSWGSDLPWEFELGLELPEPPNLSNLRIKPKHPCWKWILLNKGINLLDLASDLAILVDIANGPSGEGYLIAMGLGSIKKGLKKFATRHGLTAKNGTKINGFTRHGLNRSIGDGAKRSGTSLKSFLDAIKNPKKIEKGISSNGKPFEKFVGKNAQVTVNPITGKIISSNPLTRSGVR